jgi:uncharacterized protein (DUF3084 family)
MKMGQDVKKVESEELTVDVLKAKQQEVGKQYQDAVAKRKQLISQYNALGSQIQVMSDQIKLLEGSLRTYQDLLPRPQSAVNPSEPNSGVDVPKEPEDDKEDAGTEES